MPGSRPSSGLSFLLVPLCLGACGSRASGVRADAGQPATADTGRSDLPTTGSAADTAAPVPETSVSGAIDARIAADTRSVSDAPGRELPSSDAAASADGAAAPLPGSGLPGGLGWTTTAGGRGGQILRVTTLAASGPGSLAAAVATTGPRMIVFEVGGVIDLHATEIDINEPHAWIAGQTAPAPGITIIRGGLNVNGHDVIIQHLCVRPGEAGRPKISGWEVDAISTWNAHDVIVDHCSVTWSTDENLSASGDRFEGGNAPEQWRATASHRVTFSNNLIAEGLVDSTHSKGEHSKGSLIHDNVTEVSIVQNLYVSNRERNPLFKGGARGVVVNNYLHNASGHFLGYNLVDNEWNTGWRAHAYQTGWMSIVGNVATYGPSTVAAGRNPPFLYVWGSGPVDVHLRDNLATKQPGVDMTLVGGPQASLANVVASPPTWPPGFQAMPASAVKDFIRENVGARPWDRDAIDTRIIDEALVGRGKEINSEAEAEGYPSVPETRRSFNPDEWDLSTMSRI